MVDRVPREKINIYLLLPNAGVDRRAADRRKQRGYPRHERAERAVVERDKCRIAQRIRQVFGHQRRRERVSLLRTVDEEPFWCALESPAPQELRHERPEDVLQLHHLFWPLGGVPLRVSLGREAARSIDDR